MLYGTITSKTMIIDIDGSGPLDPFPVTCIFQRMYCACAASCAESAASPAGAWAGLSAASVCCIHLRLKRFHVKHPCEKF